MVQHPTTNIVHHVKTAGFLACYNWKILLSAYAPQHAYELGALDTRIPFQELKRRSLHGSQGPRDRQRPDFSRKIREGLPAP